MEASNKDNMLIYQSEDGKIKIDVRFENETVWLSLDQMAILFGRNKSTISRHIKNHYCPRKSFNISKSNKLIVTHQN